MLHRGAHNFKIFAVKIGIYHFCRHNQSAYLSVPDPAIPSLDSN